MASRVPVNPLVPLARAGSLTSPPVTEREAWSASGSGSWWGIVVALAGVAVLIVDLPLDQWRDPDHPDLDRRPAPNGRRAGFLRGLTLVAAEARAVQLFGRNPGTIRTRPACTG